MDASGQFIAPGWREIFATNGLSNFEDFWQCDVALFEEPNTGRGGWSAVARCELQRPGGGTAVVYLKRQRGHNTPSLRHPFRGIPTFRREFDNLLAFQKHGIPIPTPLYFAEQRGDDSSQRAILITAELTGFRSLSDVAESVPREGRRNLGRRNAVVSATAALLRDIHRAGFRHNCFYPKHVLLRCDDEARTRVEARVIDLEKAKRNWLGRFGISRDLRSLLRRVPRWNRPALLRFLLVYLGSANVTPEVRRLWRWLQRNSR